MDLTESIAPKSEQLDAVDLLGGPRTFTITNVTAGKPDQPFHFHLEGFPRTWRPSKGMRRVIVKAWGPKSDKYIGQRVTLFCDPTVKFGNDTIGGTRISHMSGINGELKVPMIIKRGQSGIFTVQPLKEAPKPAQATGEIPDNVVQQVAKAAADDNLPAYIAWLHEQGAPQHIIDYATTKAASTPEAVA